MQYCSELHSDMYVSRMSCMLSIFFSHSMRGVASSKERFAVVSSLSDFSSIYTSCARRSSQFFFAFIICNSFFTSSSFLRSAFLFSFKDTISSSERMTRPRFFSSMRASSFFASSLRLYIISDIRLYISVPVRVCSISAFSFSSALRNAAKLPCASNTARVNCSKVSPIRRGISSLCSLTLSCLRSPVVRLVRS